MPPWGRGWGWAQFDPDHIECEGRSRGDKLLLEEVGWTLKRQTNRPQLQQQYCYSKSQSRRRWRSCARCGSCSGVRNRTGDRCTWETLVSCTWAGDGSTSHGPMESGGDIQLSQRGPARIANSRKGLSRTGGGSWHQRAKGRQQHPYHGRVGVAEATREMVPTLYRFSNYSQSETQFWMCHSHSSHRRLNYSSDFSITLRIMRDPKHNLQSPHPMI